MRLFMFVLAHGGVTAPNTGPNDYHCDSSFGAYIHDEDGVIEFSLRYKRREQLILHHSALVLGHLDYGDCVLLNEPAEAFTTFLTDRFSV